MKIIIVGCGKVGLTLTEQLNNEGHDITVIDKDGSSSVLLRRIISMSWSVEEMAQFIRCRWAGIKADLCGAPPTPMS